MRTQKAAKRVGSDSRTLPPSHEEVRHHSKWKWVPVIPLLALLVYLVLAPVVVLLWTSVKPTGSLVEAGFTLKHYQAVLGDPDTLRLLWRSAAFALPSSLIAVTLGAILAWLVHRTDMPLRRLLGASLILPLGVPPALLAMAWSLILSPRIGVVNVLWANVFDATLFNIFSLPGMIGVEAIAMIPTAYFLLTPAIRNIDPTLEEAGLVSGGRPFYVVRRVVLPLLLPALLGCGILLMILGFVVFDIPGIIGMPVGLFVVSTDLYDRIRSPYALPDYGYAAALSGVFIVFLLVLGIAYYKTLRGSRKYITVTGKASYKRSFSLGRWRKPIAVAAWSYIVLGLALPLAVLAWSSLTPYYSGLSAGWIDNLSLDNYQKVLGNSSAIRAGLNSLVVAVLAATFVAVIVPVISWTVLRSPTSQKLRRFVDVLAFLPVAIPNTMIGVALILFYLNFRTLPIYGTIWVILVAHMTVFLSFGSRMSNSVLLQLSPELEEAGRTSGGNWTYVFTRVTLPLMRPALLFVWLWAAVHSLREMSASLMLQGLDNATFPTLLWDYWRLSEPTVAAAAGVLMLICLVPMAAVMRRISA